MSFRRFFRAAIYLVILFYQHEDLGPVRLPLTDLTEAESQAMIKELEGNDLYQEYFTKH